MYSSMVADILHIFPSYTEEYVMKKMSFKKFILCHMQALRIMMFNRTGEMMEIDLAHNYEVDDELDKINRDFTWNEEKQRWE